jgi:hypothetical protein
MSTKSNDYVAEDAVQRELFSHATSLLAGREYLAFGGDGQAISLH